MISLEGKKALITGGSRGIGKATSLLFARAGSDVAINYLSKRQSAEDVEEEISRIGRDCLVFKADVSRKSDIALMVRNILERWNRIDILVNNAGIWTYGEMGDMPEEIWAETMKVNLDGAFHTCNAVVPCMKEKKRDITNSIHSEMIFSPNLGVMLKS